MKKIAKIITICSALSLIFVVKPTFSQEFSPSFGEVLYFPKQGDFLIVPSFNTSIGQAGEIKFMGIKGIEFEGVKNALELNVFYNLFNSLQLGLHAGYTIKDETTSKLLLPIFLPETSISNSKGFEDPGLSLALRALDNTDPFILEFRGRFDFGIAPSDGLNSDAKAEGDAGRGGHFLDLGVLAAKRFTNLSLGLKMNMAYIGELTQTQKVSNDKNTIKAAVGFEISPFIELNFNPINLLLGYTLEIIPELESTTISSTNDKSTRKAKSDDYHAINLGLSVSLIADTLFVKARYYQVFSANAVMTQEGESYTMTFHSWGRLEFGFDLKI